MEKINHSLGCIHSRPAAEGDDRMPLMYHVMFQRIHDCQQVRFRFDIGIYITLDTGRFKKINSLLQIA